jgi:hypothetical protein
MVGPRSSSGDVSGPRRERLSPSAAMPSFETQATGRRGTARRI